MADDEQVDDGVVAVVDCISCAEYVALDGREKVGVLWKKVVDEKYDTLPQDWLGLAESQVLVDSIFDNGTANAKVNYIFDRFSDERPPTISRFSHEYGILAEFEFVPTPGGQQHFTGIYSEGTKTGLLRVSYGAPSFKNFDRFQQLPPAAVAFKFLRDGMHSANINTRQGPCSILSQNFMRRTVATTTSGALGVPGLFTAAQKDLVGVLSAQEPALYFENGTKVENPVSPVNVLFVPNPDIAEQFGEGNMDFREDFRTVNAGSLLWTVYTTLDDDGTANICECESYDGSMLPCWTLDEMEEGGCNVVQIGEIVSTSSFIASEFGDNSIMFRHARICETPSRRCEYGEALSHAELLQDSQEQNSTCVNDMFATECPAIAMGKSGSEVSLARSDRPCLAAWESAVDQCPFTNNLHVSVRATFDVPPCATQGGRPDAGFHNSSDIGNGTDASGCVSSMRFPHALAVLSVIMFAKKML